MESRISFTDICGCWAGKIDLNELNIIVKFKENGLYSKTLYGTDWEPLVETGGTYRIKNSCVVITAANGNTSEYSFSDRDHIKNDCSVLRKI